MTTTLELEGLLDESSVACSPPVIALGGGVTLGAVLTVLTEAGVPVCALGPQSDFVTRSRRFRKLPFVRCEAQPSRLAALLEELAVEQAVLMPCADDWVQAVVALPAHLSRRFPSCTPAGEVIETLVDKWRFAHLLQREHVPHPWTRLVSSYDELSTLSPSDFSGVFLKPVSSVDFSSRYGVKGFLVTDREEALRTMAGLEFPIMLQEFIPGPPQAGYFLEGFVDRAGRICALFARRRLRMYPAKLGNSTLMVSVPLDEVGGAVVALERLLTTIRYRGIFSAEFKHDQRDGTFKLLEINARPWWYLEFAHRCGVDVCSMAYRDALGMPVEAVQEYEVGRRCVFFMNDLRAWRDQRRNGLSLWSWIRPWFGADAIPFHYYDLGPALAYARSLLGERAQRRTGEKVTFWGKDKLLSAFKLLP